MGKRSIVLWCIVNPMLMIIGLGLDSACIENEIINNIWLFSMLIAWGPWGWFNLGLTIRDMFKRDLNSRWAWVMLVLISCGIGWIIYLIKYGWKERNREPVHSQDSLQSP